jgi:hypothetical protein
MTKQHLNYAKDFSDEEIIHDWTLSEKDKQMLANYRKNNRQSIAIQICAMRLYGRLLANYVNLSLKVINYINQQLDLPPTLYIQPSEREATYLEHRKNIFKHLGFTGFSNSVRTMLKNWVTIQIKKKGVPLVDELLPNAERLLLSKK